MVDEGDQADDWVPVLDVVTESADMVGSTTVLAKAVYDCNTTSDKLYSARTCVETS